MLEQPVHAQAASEVVTRFCTDAKNGLSDLEAANRLKEFGENRLAVVAGTPRWKRLASQFSSLLIGLLIVSAIIAGLLGEWIDAIVILTIVVVNGLLGFLQEDRAERAIEALRKLAAPKAKVRRSGTLLTIRADQLVRGDILELEAGDHVPADARLVTAYGLQVSEASLTGESQLSEKSSTAVLPADSELGDRRNMVYAGTTVVAGKAFAVVVATGMETEIGSIAGMLQQTASEPTPLQRRLTELGRVMVSACLAIVAVIFVLQWWRGGEIVEVFLTSVSLAVAAVPEGLPAVVTITLAIGLSRMANKNAIIRKLPSVETLGCISVICSDKTGTLTSNQMTVTEIHLAGTRFGVSGSGYSNRGAVALEHPLAPEEVSPKAPEGAPDWPNAISAAAIQTRRENSTADMVWLLQVGAMCNNAQWSWNEAAQQPNTQGDPTEVALLVAAAKVPQAAAVLPIQLLHENPFDSDRKMMSQVYRLPNDRILLVAKGAPEVIIKRSCRIREFGVEREMQAADRLQIQRDSAEMANRALRVLALACRPAEDSNEDWLVEDRLTFLGLVGMMDPPRTEAAEAVARCFTAGVRPVMITGDHPATALAVAKMLRIADDTTGSVTGQQLEAMSDQELTANVEQFKVYARVSAQHKLRVINAWKTCGHVVAMTGDGVNDAPAVKAADIGIVMGLTGTDVAKESSDMILTDDNFATIVNAVEEGRGIYENIQKFLHYLLACNTSEVMFMFIGSLTGWPTPLVPIQILWINLVTDGLPAISLAMEPIEKDLMSRPPRDPQEPFLPAGRLLKIAIHGSLMAGVALIAFWLYFSLWQCGVTAARTIAFCTVALTQVFFSMGCRSFSQTMLQVGPLSNPSIVLAMLGSTAIQIGVVSFEWTANLLGATPIGLNDWWIVFGLALLPVTLVELTKIVALGWRSAGGPK